jgi:uncharacterized membrane protein YbhN (UPF0104 family)
MMKAMRAWLQKAWPVLKLLFTVAILVAVGRYFARDLRRFDPEKHPVRFGWLVVSGGLYLVGLGFSAAFWYRLMRECGQQLAFPPAVRAYYIGHLGKYLPGKAWALLLRTTLARGPGVRLGTAALTTFYEVLTTMASGVLLAALLFTLQLPVTSAPLDWQALPRLFTAPADEQPALDPRLAVLLSVLLFGVTCGPLVPFLFNRVTNRVTRRFREPEAPPPPRVRTVQLLEGLGLTGCGWLFLGASLWASLRAFVEPAPAWGLDAVCRYTAFLGLSYVAGFVIPVPAGLGVREVLLSLFLISDLAGEPRELAAAGVWLLRLVWTAAEVFCAALLYWLPGPAAPTAGGAS